MVIVETIIIIFQIELGIRNKVSGLRELKMYNIRLYQGKALWHCDHNLAVLFWREEPLKNHLNPVRVPITEFSF